MTRNSLSPELLSRIRDIRQSLNEALVACAEVQRDLQEIPGYRGEVNSVCRLVTPLALLEVRATSIYQRARKIEE